MRLAITVVFTLVLSFSYANADTITIPADYSTIQEGIDAAVNGDIVLVEPGTYVEWIDFKGKAIHVKSSHGPETTIIKAYKGETVTFNQGEGLDSILEGFTVTHYFTGSLYYLGHGLCCKGASPTITGNIIRDNHYFAETGYFGNRGGGIFLEDSDAVIMNNLICNNEALFNAPGSVEGGGVYCEGGAPTIINNEIRNNLALGFFEIIAQGGGIACKLSSVVISGNVIEGNIVSTSTIYTQSEGGGICLSGCDAIVTDNIIRGNTAEISSDYYWARGGGIACLECTGVIGNNVISCNRAVEMPYQDNQLEGGGIYLSSTQMTLINNTLFNNEADSRGGGIACTYFTDSEVVNTILWDNHAEEGSEIAILGSYYPGHNSTLNLSYSDVEGGQSLVYVHPLSTVNWNTGMIDSDPGFADPASGDIHLTHNSPCRNAGDSNAPGLSGYDFEEDPRIAHGYVDMGADEFYTHLYVTGDTTPGGEIQGKLVGLPGATPVVLFIGSGVYETPIPTAYGNFYLMPPRILVPLIPIPNNGILVISNAIPLLPPAPYDVPMQGLVGLNPDGLTNPYVLEVR